MSSTSESEGEIIETASGEKATTAQPHVNGTTIDRASRTRTSASKSPSVSCETGHERDRSRSRSPYRHRSPRGEKRRRDDEHSRERDRMDPRRFKVHYEGGRSHDDHRRSRVSYADIDRSGPPHPTPGRRDRNGYDAYRDKRHRTRSRSPGHEGRRGDLNNRSDRYGREDSRTSFGRRQTDYYERDVGGKRHLREQSVSERGAPPPDARNQRQNAEPRRNVSQKHTASSASGTHAAAASSSQHNGQATSQTKGPNDAATEPAVVDEAALIEERRKRREAIKAKYRSQATPLLVQALHLGNDPGPATPGADDSAPRTERSVSPMTTSPSTPLRDSTPGSPAALVIRNDEELANHTAADTTANDTDGPSAADYDPIVDMQEDRARNDQRQNVNELSAAAYGETRPDQQDVLLPQSAANELAPAGKADDGFDMFADDVDDDMFASVPPVRMTTNEPSNAVPIPQAQELDQSLLDNWDDPDGYYRNILGELLDGRYHVQANLGKGMFSSVVRATDTKTNRLVAIKIIRNNETMRKAGMKEIEILQILAQADPEDKKHVIRLERWFEHKGHLCMVFENLSINLREVLKKFGRDVGINLKAVRSYAQQMFLGLSLMKKCNILHADLKPDNILVNESRNMLKICDLGSAADASENEITPYLVSRFYRAPEIILGMPYSFTIDMWSVGCTLFELFTGKILFTGRTNNQMLRSVMECRGKFSLKMLKKAEYGGLHFDDNLMFRSVEKDKVTGKDVVRMINFLKPTRDLKSRLLSAAKGMNDVEMKELNLFADLLDRCLNLNPDRRCTPVDALNHPFINRKKP